MHELHQFHYQGWQDFGTPCSVESLLELIEAVRYHCEDLETSHPLVVHCT